MKRTPWIALVLTAIISSAVLASESTSELEPLVRAHAHNDYQHERPLFDALDRGFTSVEADIFLSDGKLLVGHERSELKPERTLESLYLEPLARRISENDGRVHKHGRRFFLLIDLKSEGRETYRALQAVLAKYAQMLTTIDHGKLRPGAVTIVISGNRPIDDVRETDVCYVGLDGRISDLESKSSALLMPMISDAWPSHFTWRGEGPIPPAERAKLRGIVNNAHRAKRLVRFWATPENKAVWLELKQAGVDLIGTDQLDQLAEFLRSADGGVTPVHRVQLPTRPPIELKLIAKLGPGPGKENSGIVKSRQNSDVFWIHNDSGDEPRIYPVNRHGKNYSDERYPEENGVLIGGAINVDWEDITTDADGHLIIADLGNNENDRRDLVLYYLDEPAPTAGRTTFHRKAFLRYPNQDSFPPGPNDFNFDCEAIFTVGNTVFLLSKNRGNTYTSLYRLDEAKNPDETNTLTLLDTLDIQGQAVGADCTPDGKRLAVLTYSGVWLFERHALDQEFFKQNIFWAPFPHRDAEAICFADDHTLLVADESLGELYEVRISDLTRVQ